MACNSRSFNLKNLQSSLSQKEERLESCDKAKGALNGELEEKARRLREKEEECGDVRRRNVRQRKKGIFKNPFVQRFGILKLTNAQKEASKKNFPTVW